MPFRFRRNKPGNRSMVSQWRSLNDSAWNRWMAKRKRAVASAAFPSEWVDSFLDQLRLDFLFHFSKHLFPLHSKPISHNDLHEKSQLLKLVPPPVNLTISAASFAKSLPPILPFCQEENIL